MRKRISALISQRSVLRRRQYPTRTNSIVSLLFIVLVLPLSLMAFLFFGLSTIAKRRTLKVAVLDVDNEFAPFIETMEYLRSDIYKDIKWDLVMVLSVYSHKTLDRLYSQQLQAPIIRSHGLFGLFQQVLLLQPPAVITLIRLTGGKQFALPKSHLPIDDVLFSLRESTLASVGLSNQDFVALAVYSLQYDEERDPKEAIKHASLESRGDDLASGVDYLRQSGYGVVLLGSPDTKKSKVPRNIPRLSEFGEVGGAHEIALASGCRYFWNDCDVGAWWLGLPFKKPILTTNKPRMRLRTDFSDLEHLVVPIRYQRLDGTFVTVRELLSMKTAPFKEASAGRLLMIRNSRDEIIEAHREMKARIDGTWNVDSEMKTLDERCRKVFADYPEAFPMKISSYFLGKHHYLLD